MAKNETIDRDCLVRLGISLRYAGAPATAVQWTEYAERVLSEAAARGLVITIRRRDERDAENDEADAREARNDAQDAALVRGGWMQGPEE